MANEGQFSCRVFNRTPETVSNYAVWIHMEGGCSTGAPSMASGEWTIINRGGTETLKLQKDGLRWEGVQGQELSVVNGGEYTIVLDDRCPPLSSAEIEAATALVFDMVEVGRMIPCPLPSSSTACTT